MASITETYEEVATPRLDLLSPLDRFWHDLPLLLPKKLGKWVAYTSEGAYLEGEEEQAVYRQCEQCGLEPGKYVVAQVLPDQPEAELLSEGFE